MLGTTVPSEVNEYFKAIANGMEGGSVSLLLRELYRLAIREEVFGKHQEAVAENNPEITIKAKQWAQNTQAR